MNKMGISSFRDSLSEPAPPETMTGHARALWYAGKGDWNKAHEIIQDIGDSFASRIHAFLHRQEGDVNNANYWYQKAGARMPERTLDEEWSDLVATLMKS